MPVTFPPGKEPAVLSENPNGTGDQKHSDGKDKATIQDFMSKGPVQANAEDYPPARSSEELKAETERLNQK